MSSEITTWDKVKNFVFYLNLVNIIILYSGYVYDYSGPDRYIFAFWGTLYLISGPVLLLVGIIKKNWMACGFIIFNYVLYFSLAKIFQHGMVISVVFYCIIIALSLFVSKWLGGGPN